MRHIVVTGPGWHATAQSRVCEATDSINRTKSIQQEIILDMTLFFIYRQIEFDCIIQYVFQVLYNKIKWEKKYWEKN